MVNLLSALVYGALSLFNPVFNDSDVKKGYGGFERVIKGCESVTSNPDFLFSNLVETSGFEAGDRFRDGARCFADCFSENYSCFMSELAFFLPKVKDDLKLDGLLSQIGLVVNNTFPESEVDFKNDLISQIYNHTFSKALNGDVVGVEERLGFVKKFAKKDSGNKLYNEQVVENFYRYFYDKGILDVLMRKS